MGPIMTSFKDRIAQLQDRVEARLEACLPGPEEEPPRLHQAMRYAVLDGGKRFRPLLVYAAGEALGVSPDVLDAPAIAVELVHCFSLVHDDLPAMDDDDLRRGRATVHVAFDEATAILAGDALHVLAFEALVANPQLADEPEARLDMVRVLARACGSRGMTGGQAMDLAAEGQQLTEAQLETLHSRKTGDLIRASILLACAARPGLDAQRQTALERFGRRLGLAFQVTDDLLDIEGSTERLGKPQGADQALDKATYPRLLGMDGAKRKAAALYDEALEYLAPLGGAADPLRAMLDLAVHRDH